MKKWRVCASSCPARRGRWTPPPTFTPASTTSPIPEADKPPFIYPFNGNAAWRARFFYARQLLQYDRGYLPGIFMQVLQTYFFTIADLFFPSSDLFFTICAEIVCYKLKYHAHSCISLRGASSLLRLRCADILFLGNYLAENRDFPAYFVNSIYQSGGGKT